MQYFFYTQTHANTRTLPEARKHTQIHTHKNPQTLTHVLYIDLHDVSQINLIKICYIRYFIKVVLYIKRTVMNAVQSHLQNVTSVLMVVSVGLMKQVVRAF